MNRQLLTDLEINERLKSLSGWDLVNGKLRREFLTGSFVNGVSLINRVMAVAEELHHHPDIMLTYPKVVIETVTHDSGGITDFDFALALRIDAMYRKE